MQYGRRQFIRATLVASLGATFALTACQPEQRPGSVQVIGTPKSGSVSASVSGVHEADPAAAAKAAEVLCQLVGGKGKVGMIPFIKGAASSEQREQGFREGIKKCPGVTLGPVLYSQSQVERAMQVTEDMLTANPDLVGIFAANEPGAVGAATVLEQRKLAGKVKLVAFDAAQPEIDALKRGTIQALIVQNPFKMGYEGVKLAVKAIKGDRASIPKRVDTGVTVVTKENLDSPEVQELLKERQ